MLAMMIAGLGALYAAILAIERSRTFLLEIRPRGTGSRPSAIDRLERRRGAAAIHPGARGASDEAPPDDGVPAPTHTPRT